MSNWENRVLLFIRQEMERFFTVPPTRVRYNFRYMDRRRFLKAYEGEYDKEEYQKAWEIEVDELVFVICLEDGDYWSLNEDSFENLQVWGEKGIAYVHFERRLDDDILWYELEIG